MKIRKPKAFTIGILVACALGVLIMIIIFIQNREVAAARSNEVVVEVISTDLNDNMIEGDCILITYGDIEILIDTASAQGNNGKTFEKIKDSMTKVMQEDTEKKWDYIFFTHPDEDHIGNYSGVFSLFENEWSIGTIIDFDVVPDEGDSSKYTYTANKYRKSRQELIRKGVSYFSASELKPDNLTKTYVLNEGNAASPQVKLIIMYNYFDDLPNVKLNGDGSIADKYKNLLSVCFMLQIGDQKLLFTGDLTKSGEEQLLYYHKNLLKNVTFFKAAHHGSQGGKNSDSPASNIEEFVDWIKPAYVSITSMSGAANPDESINHFRKYTDCIYPAYVSLNDEFYKMYGNQKLIFDGKTVSVETDENSISGKVSSLIDAYIYDENGKSYNWYSECEDNSLRNIKDSLYVYTFDDVVDGEVSGKAEYYNCTLVKYGNYDILIDCGSSSETSDSFVQKLKEYVVDGKIDCLIVTHNKPYCISQIAGNYTLNDKGERTVYKQGIVDSFEIGRLIDNPYTNFDEKNTSGCLYRYRLVTNNLPNHISLKSGDTRTIETSKYGPVINVYGSSYTKTDDENDYSMLVVIEFRGKKLVFVGDLSNYGKLIDKYKDKVKNANFLRLSNSVVATKDQQRFEEFAKLVNPQYIVIGTPLYYSIEGLGKEVFDDADQAELLRIFNSGLGQNIYYPGYDVVYPGQHYYYRENGDVVYTLSYQAGRVFTDISKISSDNSWIAPSTLEKFFNGR